MRRRVTLKILKPRMDTKAVIARFVINFDDWSQETMPVKFLDVVADQVPQNLHYAEAGKVSRRGFKRTGTLYEISKLVWENPHPDKTINALDFISTKTKAGPVLFGVTLE